MPIARKNRQAERQQRQRLALGTITRHELMSQRFWPFVLKGSSVDCWEWRGALKDTGYGQMSIRSLSTTPLKAHRVAWELTHGPIPNRLFVLHRCDNRRCVNPDHLFLGTNHDNVKDMWAKGRAVIPQWARQRKQAQLEASHADQ